ncbi:MAG: hypothetical protein RLY31_257 [Bacteroidota bacterium]|jgi:membrane-associated phospholipid phosphatase
MQSLMWAIIRRSKTYFILMAWFLTVGGYLWISTDRVDAILYLNGVRNHAADQFFPFITRFGEVWLFALVALVALTYRIRLAVLVGLTGLSALVVSTGLKSYFQVDRPLAFFRQLGMDAQLQVIPGIELHTGATSFPSGHTTAAFALYGLLAIFSGAGPVRASGLFVIALLVGISRVYLIQHFWADVYWGGLIGTLLAVGMYRLDQLVVFPPGSILNRPLFRVSRRSAGARN